MKPKKEPQSLALTPILYTRFLIGQSSEFYVVPSFTYEHIVQGMAKFRFRFLGLQVGVEFHYKTVDQHEKEIILQARRYHER